MLSPLSFNISLEEIFKDALEYAEEVIVIHEEYCLYTICRSCGGVCKSFRKFTTAKDQITDKPAICPNVNINKTHYMVTNKSILQNC